MKKDYEILATEAAREKYGGRAERPERKKPRCPPCEAAARARARPLAAPEAGGGEPPENSGSGEA